MTLRSLAIIGGIMIACVVFTMVQTEISSDPPGVTTRWWDGTTEKVETFHENGKPASRITYGDDGKTVLTQEEWDYQGNLTHSKIRREDGKLEEKQFQPDGTLLSYILWEGDESFWIVNRRYHWNGKLAQEVIKTEDGSAVLEQRQYFTSGQLKLEEKILSNANRSAKHFHENGQLYIDRLIDPYGGEKRKVYDNLGNLKTEMEISGALAKVSYSVKTYSNGEVVKHLVRPDDGAEILKAYSKGKLEYVQHFNSVRQFVKLELFENGETQPTRVVETQTQGLKISVYREDGTLKSVKFTENGEIHRQVDYDVDGKEIGEVTPEKLLPINAEALEDQSPDLRNQIGR